MPEKPLTDKERLVLEKLRDQPGLTFGQLKQRLRGALEAAEAEAGWYALRDRGLVRWEEALQGRDLLHLYAGPEAEAALLAPVPDGPRLRSSGVSELDPGL